MTGVTAIRGIEHVGLTVPDHAAAIGSLRRAPGAQELYSLTDKGRDPLPGEALGPGNGLRRGTAIVAVSMPRPGNSANLEVFEIDRPGGRSGAGISDLGLSHFSLAVDDIDAACAAFADAGGDLLEGPYALTDQEAGPGNRGRFGLTPWGLLVEFEQLPSPMRLDPGAQARRRLPAPRGGDGPE